MFWQFMLCNSAIRISTSSSQMSPQGHRLNWSTFSCNRIFHIQNSVEKVWNWNKNHQNANFFSGCWCETVWFLWLIGRMSEWTEKEREFGGWPKHFGCIQLNPFYFCCGFFVAFACHYKWCDRKKIRQRFQKCIHYRFRLEFLVIFASNLRLFGLFLSFLAL